VLYKEEPRNILILEWSKKWSLNCSVWLVSEI